MPKNPHADFSPVLDGYSGIGAFRFWCQTALPLTYDDSLSYYELLCKVVNYLNHAIEDLSNVEENTGKLDEAYTKLQNYVNEYFDKLDIEAELRNVLDAMAQDGTLDALLDPLVTNHLPDIVDDKIDDVVANQIGNVVADQIDETVAQQLPAVVATDIPAEVTNWLNANVNPVGSAVVVDNTLSISGAAADAKVTGDTVSDLKESLENINYIFPVGYSNKYVKPSNGNVASNNNWDYIEIDVNGLAGELFEYSTILAPNFDAGWVVYDAYGNKLSSGTDATGTITLPEKCEKIAISIFKYNSPGTTYNDIKYKADFGKTIVKTKTVDEINDDITSLNNDIASLENSLGDITETKNNIIGTVSLKESTFTTGRVDITTGDVLHDYDPAYVYSEKITVTAGDKISVYKNTNPNREYYGRWVTAYNGNTVVPNAGSSIGGLYTVPAGIDGVIVTTYATYNATGIKIVKETNYGDSIVIKNNPLGYFSAKGNLTNAQKLELNVNNVKNNIILAFNARISAFSSIKIGTNPYPYIVIDSTNITVYCNSSEHFEQAHGITITNDISVILFGGTKASNVIDKIIVSSNGHEYTFTNQYCAWRTIRNAYFAESIGSTLVNAELSWTSRNINKPIWIFGDSYIDFYTSRWAYYLIRDELDTSVMLNGYAGEGSNAAIDALEALLTIRVPKIIIWCLGMNDPDSAEEVNENWLNGVYRLAVLSKQYGFDYILATIPLVTSNTCNNTQKNLFVKNSGKRYIDFSGAVNTGDNGEWIGDGLSQDGVHPTTQGAIMLYHKFVTDFPEITTL